MLGITRKQRIFNLAKKEYLVLNEKLTSIKKEFDNDHPEVKEMLEKRSFQIAKIKEYEDKIEKLSVFLPDHEKELRNIDTVINSIDISEYNKNRNKIDQELKDIEKLKYEQSISKKTVTKRVSHPVSTIRHTSYFIGGKMIRMPRTETRMEYRNQRVSVDDEEKIKELQDKIDLIKKEIEGNFYYKIYEKYNDIEQVRMNLEEKINSFKNSFDTFNVEVLEIKNDLQSILEQNKKDQYRIDRTNRLLEEKEERSKVYVEKISDIFHKIREIKRAEKFLKHVNANIIYIPNRFQNPLKSIKKIDEDKVNQIINKIDDFTKAYSKDKVEIKR